MTRNRKVGLAGRRRNCRRLSSAATGSTHFFKIMLPSVFLEKQLRIPKKFIQRFGDELSAVATLAVPNGCFHDVKLKQVEDEIYFKDGWCEFVKDHSICVNDLLVFNYKGNSRFGIIIFDATATEICYLCNAASSGWGRQCPGHHQHDEEMEDDCYDDEIVILESSTPPGLALSSINSRKQIILNKNYSPASLKNKEFRREYLTRTKKLKIGILNDQSSSGNLKIKTSLDQFSGREPRIDLANSTNSDEDMQLVEIDREVDLVGIQKFSRSSLMKKFEVTREQYKAIHAARMHKTKNPSFIAILKSHNIVTVPLDFALQLQISKAKYIKLRVSDGREWKVRCTCTAGKARSICKGWAKFRSENNLREGDVCVFELIQIIDILLRVTFFRVDENAGP